LAAALSAQLEQWRATLEAGAYRVGWKLGIGDAERIGDEPAIGHLTSATLLEPGATYRGTSGAALHVDAEVALEIGRDVAPDADAVTARRAIAAYASALEVVDLATSDERAEAVIAGNVFHRAVAFGQWQAELPPARFEGRLVVDGDVRAAATAQNDVTDCVCAAARLLDAVDERLRAGDRLITGSVVQVPVKPGDGVVADFGVLGGVRVEIR
jgi:2-keto-4-pentenoate hydratase